MSARSKWIIGVTLAFLAISAWPVVEWIRYSHELRGRVESLLSAERSLGKQIEFQRWKVGQDQKRRL